LGTETVDIAVTSDRENDTLAIFKIDPSSRQLVNITSDELSTGDFSIFGVDDGEATAYGLAGYKSPLTGKDYVFVTQAGGNQIAQLELKADNTGAITGSVVRTLTLPLEEGEDATDFDPADYQSEAIVVDQEFGTVYVGVEGKLGIVKFAAEPNGGDTISIVRPIDSPELKPDLEGLGLYYGADGKGYLIASSQGDSSYAVYTREGNNNYLGSFIVGDNPTLGIDQANETDGLDIVNLPLGSQFPLGALLVHDGANEPQNAVENDDELENNSTNFKFVPWEGVANAFDKPLTIDTESYNPRSPVNRLVPSVSVTDGAVVEGISNQVSVIVSLSAASNQTITVDYQTGEQTAKAGQDYSSVSDTITFAPGETSQTLTIPILDDDISEDFETFAVELKKASNIQLPDSVASAVIEEVSSSLNQSPDDFEILEATEQTWPNGCLGLPGLDEVCTQALVPGWQVKVTDKQQTWVYRTDDDGSSIRLETVIPYVPLSGVKIEDSQGIVTISDVVSADTDFTLPARVENLDLIGADNISGTGNDNPNQITGNAGDNNLNGLAGADILTGGKGDDQLLGGSEEDILSGKKGKDSLLGDEGKDTLKGNGGKDNLNGGLGKDLLTGGAGKDIFEFSSQDDLFDRITDFVSGLDKIALDSSGFEGLTRGSLNEAQFVLGSRAEDESDRLIYNPNTGALFFDPDGTGEMGKMKMVVLEDQPLVRAEDIMIL
jgi:myo-inositol-hexaphosphate 3-phosphohydrolase